MKIAAILLIVCSCAGIGLSAASRLRQREQRWRAWERLLHRLYGMLSYSGAPIQSLLAEMPKDDLKELRWLESYQTGESPLVVPQGLPSEEQQFAQRVFRTLGTTDLEGQLRHLEYCARCASDCREAAAERAAKTAKVYASTGICAGVCLGLLLI